MNTTQSGAPRLATRILPIAVLVGAASLVATVTYSNEKGETVSYACLNGERFVIEHQPGHIRLRTGAGVFALVGEPSEDVVRYSDGSTVFWMRGDEAVLERPGLATPDGCTATTAAL